MSSARTTGAVRPTLVDTPHGKAIQVPVDFFLTKILPPLPRDVALDTLIDNKLRDGSNTAPITMHGRLWGYTKKNPSGVHGRDERKVYAALQRDVHLFVKAVDSHKSEVVFRNNPRAQPGFGRRVDVSQALPDAYFTLSSCASDAPRWSDIAVPGQYKRAHNAQTVQNVRVVLLEP